MKRLSILLAVLAVVAASQAARLMPEQILARTGIVLIDSVASLDTVVISPTGIPVHITVADRQLRRPGLSIFTPAMRSVINPLVADYAEHAALDRLLSLHQEQYAQVRFPSGSVKNLTAITDAVPFSYQCTDKGVHIMSWELADGSETSMEFELDYLVLASGSRSGAEKDFVEALSRVKQPVKRSLPQFNPADAEDYKTDLKLLRGNIFRIPEVSGNIYLTVDNNGQTSAVNDADNYPCETLANLWLCGVEDVDPTVKLRIVGHNIGEFTYVTTTLGKLLQLCKEQGCVPYFGMKSMENGHLRATVFMHNEAMGYLHLFSLDLPIDALDGRSEITARTSLYVPVKNVADLYYEQRARTKPIKINISK